MTSSYITSFKVKHFLINLGNDDCDRLHVSLSCTFSHFTEQLLQSFIVKFSTLVLSNCQTLKCEVFCRVLLKIRLCVIKTQ